MSAVIDQDLTVSAGADFSPASGESLAVTEPWIIDGAIQDLTGFSTILKVRLLSTDVSPYLSLSNVANANGSSVAPNGTAGTCTFDINNLDTVKLPSNLGPLQYQLAVISPITLSSIAHTAGGTGPLVRASGTPAAVYSFVVDITSSGNETSAIFRWSSDGGNTFTTGATAGPAVTLGSTGVVLDFPAGSYSTSPLDAYTWISIAGVRTILQAGRVFVIPNGLN